MSWKECEGCQFWINLSSLSGIFLLRLMKTFINLRQDNWSLGWYLNQGSPRCEATVLTTSQYLVDLIVIGWISVCRFDVLKQCWWRQSSGIGRRVDLWIVTASQSACIIFQNIWIYHSLCICFLSRRVTSPGNFAGCTSNWVSPNITKKKL